MTNKLQFDETELYQAVQEESIVRLLQKVIQTESTNPPGYEIELARWLQSYLEAAGLQTVLKEYEPNRVNVVARLKGSGERPALIFSAHMDTVPAGEQPWRFPPFSGTLHEGYIYGRGAADMKGGLATMVEAAVILARSGYQPKGDLIVALTYDETHGLRGAKHLVDEGALADAGALLVSEPSSLNVFTAEKGALWLRATAKGKTSHTSMPHLGENAIFEMAHFLTRLETDLDLFDVEHPLLGKATMTVGTIHGGVTINVTPDRCVAEIDIRLVPGQDYSQAIEQVRQIAGEKVHIDLIDWKAPVESDTQDDFVKLALQAVESVTGQPKAAMGVSYYTDAAVLANRLGLPFVNIGPADTGMTHQPNENVEVSRLVQAVKIYLSIARRYLG